MLESHCHYFSVAKQSHVQKEAELVLSRTIILEFFPICIESNFDTLLWQKK